MSANDSFYLPFSTETVMLVFCGSGDDFVFSFVNV